MLIVQYILREIELLQFNCDFALQYGGCIIGIILGKIPIYTYILVCRNNDLLYMAYIINLVYYTEREQIYVLLEHDFTVQCYINTGCCCYRDKLSCDDMISVSPKMCYIDLFL